jgi:hypothetical protein
MIKEVFELFDTDGQQQLDEEELACAIYTLGFSQNGHIQVGFLLIKPTWQRMNAFAPSILLLSLPLLFRPSIVLLLLLSCCRWYCSFFDSFS